MMTYLSPSLKTRLYLDSSSDGTQARVAQKRHIDKEDVWRPVNYTSRAWASAEAGYGQIERESNGILTGMHKTRCILLAHMLRSWLIMHPFYLHTTHPTNPSSWELIALHQVITIWYNVVYEPGKITPCDYGSCHPPPKEERVDWPIGDETDIFISQVIQDQLPQAITLEILRAATAIDPDLQLLKEDIITNKTCRNHLVSFQKIFHELPYIERIIMRGSQAVIPTSLQAEIVG